MTIGQAGFGLYQTIKGARDAKNNVRPTYEIPQSMIDAMDDAERMAMRGLPEQTRQNFLQGMVDTRAASFEGLSDRKAGIGAVAGVQQREIAGQQQLAQMDAEQRIRNISALQQMRQQMAQFEDREFQINQMQPFQDRAAAASAMQGAGLQNIMGAATTFAKSRMAKKSLGDDNSSNDNSVLTSDPAVKNQLDSKSFNSLDENAQRMLSDNFSQGNIFEDFSQGISQFGGDNISQDFYQTDLMQDTSLQGMLNRQGGFLGLGNESMTSPSLSLLQNTFKY